MAVFGSSALLLITAAIVGRYYRERGTASDSIRLFESTLVKANQCIVGEQAGGLVIGVVYEELTWLSMSDKYN